MSISIITAVLDAYSLRNARRYSCKAEVKIVRSKLKLKMADLFSLKCPVSDNMQMHLQLSSSCVRTGGRTDLREELLSTPQDANALKDGRLSS